MRHVAGRWPLWVFAVVPFGCAERVVLDEMDACDVERAVPVATFDSQEYPDWYYGLRTEAGQVVGISRYADDVLALSGSFDAPWGVLASEQSESSSYRALWVERCADSWALPSDGTEYAEVRPGGPFAVRTPSSGAVVRDLRDAAVREPLPGNGRFFGVLADRVLGLDEAGYYLWDPDEPHDARRWLAGEFAGVVQPTHSVVLDEVFMLKVDRSLWAIRVEDGAWQPLATNVANAITPDGRHFLIEYQAVGSVWSRVSWIDRERGIEEILSQNGRILDIDRLSSGEVYVVLEERIPGPSPEEERFGTSLLYLPEGDILQWTQPLYSAASDEPDVYLRYGKKVYRVDRSTGLEEVVPFGAAVEIHEDWLYAISWSDDATPGSRVHRRPLATVDAPFELVIDQSRTWPFMLRDGTWVYLRGEGEQQLGELLLWSPDTGTAEVLATGVAPDVVVRTFHRGTYVRPRIVPDHPAVLAFVTIEPGKGGTLWNYRVHDR